MNPDHITRRRVLQLSGSATAISIAGCAGGGDGDDGGDGTSPADDPGGGDASASLSVSDVETDDRTVVVPGATIDAEGWLVMHPASGGGSPITSEILGYTALSAGEQSDVEVRMTSLQTGEQTVYAMLHYDDPADGEFTYPDDGDPAVTTGGNAVTESFTVTLSGDVTPSLSVTEQESRGDRLTISEAAIDQPGWLVVHPEADGGGPDGSTTLGARELQPGLYADLEVELDPFLADSQTVYAMLHYDDPADGEFTFPDEGDPAVTQDGESIVEPFEVDVQPTVEAPGQFFEPTRISVSPGQTVTWVNRTSTEHDVTSAQFHDQATAWDFSASLASKGSTASHTFDSEGIYEYECTIHGDNSMCGVVLVGDVTLDGQLPCEGYGGGLLNLGPVE